MIAEDLLSLSRNLTPETIHGILYLTLPAGASQWVGLTVKEAERNNGED